MNELKILVVDDESRMRKLVKDFLTRAGYQVLEAQDGEEAVDTFYSIKGINLLVLDVMMPKMDFLFHQDIHGFQTIICRYDFIVFHFQTFLDRSYDLFVVVNDQNLWLVHTFPPRIFDGFSVSGGSFVSADIILTNFLI